MMKNQEGFTLLELLISITLIAVLVVVLSMALRTGINAYTRSKDYNRFYLPRTALYSLLWRQLEAITPNSNPYSLFVGEKDALTFTTTCVPQGTGQGGIFQVAYLFDESEDRIIYGQKIITVRKNLESRIPEDLLRLDSERLSEKGWLTDEIQDVEEFLLTYKPTNARDKENPDDWKDTVRRGSFIPSELAFKLRFKKQHKKDEPWQVLPVGIK